MTHVDVSYQTILTNTEDEAVSLAGYLTEHGVFAIVTDDNHVSALSDDTEAFETIQTLKRTWRLFWDNSDSGLFGLPLFVKES